MNHCQDMTTSASNEHVDVYGVFDGHNNKGEIVADFLANGTSTTPSLAELICAKIIDTDDDTENIIEKCFSEMDAKLLEIGSINAQSGATGTLAIVFDNHIYISYVGDSACAVWIDDEHYLTTKNHNISCNEMEKKRLQDDENITYKKSPDLKVLSPTEIKIIKNIYHCFKYNENKIDCFACTRAFGHLHTKLSNNKFIIKPTTHVIPIDKDKEYKIFIGSDGVWDMLIDGEKEKELKTIIDESKTKNEDIAKNIVNYTMKRWKQDWKVKYKGEMHTSLIEADQWDDISACYIEI